MCFGVPGKVMSEVVLVKGTCSERKDDFQHTTVNARVLHRYCYPEEVRFVKKRLRLSVLGAKE